MPEQTKARVTTEQREAIRRLIAIALSDTGQSRRVADFLLAGHNGGENGGWDPVDLWSLDQEIAADVLTTIGAMLSSRSYPGELGFDQEIDLIWELWRGGKSEF